MFNASVPGDANIVQLSDYLATPNQTVQMRDALSASHGENIAINGATEQNLEALHCGLWGNEGLAQLLQGSLMTVDQLLYSRVQSFEWSVVRWQYEHVIGSLESD